jgi:hypothetical protein
MLKRLSENKWVRRFGLAGVVAFTIKGLLWLSVPVVIAKGCFG